MAAGDCAASTNSLPYYTNMAYVSIESDDVGCGCDWACIHSDIVVMHSEWRKVQKACSFNVRDIPQDTAATYTTDQSYIAFLATDARQPVAPEIGGNASRGAPVSNPST